MIEALRDIQANLIADNLEKEFIENKNANIIVLFTIYM